MLSIRYAIYPLGYLSVRLSIRYTVYPLYSLGADPHGQAGGIQFAAQSQGDALMQPPSAP
jgi:hypothetical protein